jgi:DNA-binding MurR/RpiR family transcriptional regulator
VVSSSGEAPAAAMAAEAAHSAGARMLVVTTEGGLREWASAHRVPTVGVESDSGPAAGLGVVIVPILVLLERLGLATGMSRLISGAAEQLDARRRAIDDDPREIDAIAEAIRGRVAVVCGAGAIGKNAARRWVQTLDRVGGVASIRRRLPVNPDDVATWSRLADQITEGLVAIVLRHDHEPEGLTGGRDLLGEAVVSVCEVTARGDGALAQLLDLVLVADAVAAAVRTDPNG